MEKLIGLILGSLFITMLSSLILDIGLFVLGFDFNFYGIFLVLVALRINSINQL